MNIKKNYVFAVIGLVLLNIMNYSALASFSLRPHRGERLLPVMTFLFLAGGLGGLFMPRVTKLYLEGVSRLATPVGWLRILPFSLIAFLVGLMSVPGYRFWLTNEPSRYLAAAGMGLLLVATYSFYFDAVAPARRGLWFGVATGAGIFTWRLFMRFADFCDGESWNGFPAALRAVYWVHTLVAVLLACVLLYAYAAFPVGVGRYASSFSAALSGRERKANIFFLLAGAFLLYLMNGFLEVRLFPVMPVHEVPPFSTLHILMIACSLLMGWLFDRGPERSLWWMLRIGSWFFLLAPSLTILTSASAIYEPIHSGASLSQFSLLVALSVALAGLAKSGSEAGLLAGLVFGMRLVSFVWYRLLQRLPDLAPGVVVLLGTILAVFFYLAVKRVDLRERRPRPGPDDPADPAGPHALPFESGDPADEDGDGRSGAGGRGMDAFLDSRPLTPREREIAVMLIAGAATRDIAAALGISENTVRTHVRNLLSKFGVNSRKAFVAAYADGDVAAASTRLE